jgi:tRNA A-37 threonylcarbamoyl transferase component Bud32
MTESTGSHPPSAEPADDDAPEISIGDPWIGEIIAEKYRVVSRLGEGGMAIVYEAENVAIKKRVALKIAQGPDAIRDDVEARFTREIEASSRVEHPHVAAVFDGGKLPTGEPYLVSQLLRGQSLHDRLGAGPIAWKEACAITAQIADGLAAIHAAGFVHRDLTPSNIQLSESSTGGVHVFVFDLGIAAPIDRNSVPSSAFKTTIGAAVGTPGYMSPEQAVAGAVSARSDLYVLGLLFFEMLTAKPVLDSDLPIPTLTKQMLEDDLTLPSPTETGIPAELDALARQLLSSESSRRPADATAVRWAFSTWATGSPTAPTEPASKSPRDDAIVPSADIAPAAPAASPVAVRPRARGAFSAALLLGAVLAAAALVYAYVGTTEPDPIAEIDAAALATPASSSDTAAALSEVEEALLRGRPRAREEAASTVLAAEDGAYPRYARLVAAMTLARGCDARLAQIQALAALGDARALPALERIDHSPRTGCGRRSREDCHACARDALASAIRGMVDAGPPAP